MKYVPAGVTRLVGRTTLKTQKHAPTILFVSGVAGMVGSTVLACKATLKLEEVLNEQDDKIQQSETLLATNNPDYTAEDQSNDVRIIKVQTIVEIGKLYAPAAIVGGLSILALTRSHIMLNKRNAALTAAYAATEKAFREYRKRVAEEFGEEKEKEIRYAAEETKSVDPETGKKTKVKHAGPDGSSQYARFFRPDNKNWNPTHELNLMFIKGCQNMLNDKLRADGHVYLNDAYRALGLPDTPAGSVMGWIWDPQGNVAGDNYIDFGVWTDKNLDRFHDYMVGREAELLLDFNVDEKPIWDLI